MLEARAALAAPDVLQFRTTDGFEQAGPNPVGEIEGALPDGILRYPADVKAKQPLRHRRRFG